MIELSKEPILHAHVGVLLHCVGFDHQRFLTDHAVASHDLDQVRAGSHSGGEAAAAAATSAATTTTAVTAATASAAGGESEGHDHQHQNPWQVALPAKLLLKSLKKRGFTPLGAWHDRGGQSTVL